MRSRFSPIAGEHRLEEVAVKGGVRYVNDSKATNTNSTWFALEQTRGPIAWIAGGVETGNSYTSLVGVVREKVEALYILGGTSFNFRKAFSFLPLVTVCESMHEAVVSATVLAEPGWTVLLSPACASFDLFESYQERGWAFKREVARL